MERNMINADLLKSEAVDAKELSTNFIDIISDCTGTEGFSLRSELQNRFPLAAWLLGTSFARTMRQMSIDPQVFIKSDTEGVDWEMKVPGTIWTLAPANTSAECCWTMPDFAKCASTVPMNLLCLKDCDSIFDSLVYRRLRINGKTSVPGIASPGESMETVNERIARLWMAFYTAQTLVLGSSNASTTLLKPFHGLFEVLNNPAVINIFGGNILSAFDSLGCRLNVLGDLGDYVIAVNPLIYQSIAAEIKPGQFGDLPDGWAIRDGRIYFKGIRFLEDKAVPVDMTASTGEAWVLHGGSVGAFLAYNIGDAFHVEDGIDTSENNCGSQCDYYYNFGAVANNNANRLAVITDIPVRGACASVLGDLANLINPTTLIPHGVNA